MSEAGEAKLHFLDYWRVIRVRWGIILLVFLLVMITATVTTYFMPKKYSAGASLQLEQDSRTLEFMGQTPVGISPQFVATQYAIIQKKEILYPVIEKLKLEEAWATDGQPMRREAAWYTLRNMLDVQQVRNTEMIEIVATSTSPEEAAKIANTVAEIYGEKRNEQQVEKTDTGVTTLKSQVQEQDDKVKAAQDAVNRLRAELYTYGIIDTGDERDMTLQSPIQQVLLTKEQEVNASRTKLATIRSQLENVGRLSNDDLIAGLDIIQIADPTVRQILPQLKQAVADEARLLNSGLGRGHPAVKAVRAQMDVFAKQLREQGEAIRQSLATAVRIEEGSLASQEEQLIKIRAQQQDAKVKSSEFIVAKQRLAYERELYQQFYADLKKKEVGSSIPRMPVKIWEKAEAPANPSSPKWPLNLALGAVVGLVVGIGLAFFIEYLDTSVKTMEDVENFLGVPVLAIIPKDIDLLHKVSGDTPDAEAYRILRTNIEFNRKSATANTISMVSGGPGEGKSTTLANMAYTFAQGGYAALIVDADLRRPTQHKLFGLSNDVGLTTYLTTDIRLDDVIFPTGFDNLQIMPSGILPTDAVGILNSQRMSDMITELKGRYDMVFFDSPPILGVSDASVLASEVDLCILVVQHRRFPRSMLTRVKQSVINVGGTILGVVLNNVDLKHDPNYQYYTSYYDYYAPRRDDEAAPEPRAKAVSAPRGQREDDQY